MSTNIFFLGQLEMMISEQVEREKNIDLLPNSELHKIRDALIMLDFS